MAYFQVLCWFPVSPSVFPFLDGICPSFLFTGLYRAWFAVLEDKELYESRPDGAFSSQQAKTNMAISHFALAKWKLAIVTLGFSFGCPFFLCWGSPSHTAPGGDDVVLSRSTCGHPWWLGLKLCFATFGLQSFIGCLGINGEDPPTPKNGAKKTSRR